MADKTFNLGRAMNGDPIQTKSGEKVKFLHFLKGNEYPVAVVYDDGFKEYINRYTVEGIEMA